MALSNIELVRVITQDNGKLPFLDEGAYILSDDEIEAYLTMQGDDVMQAARMAAYSIAMWISGVNTKEVFGEVEMWNEAGKNYLKALNSFLSDKSLVSVIPKGVMPYAAGTSQEDLYNSMSNVDNPNIGNWLYQDKGGCDEITYIIPTY